MRDLLHYIRDVGLGVTFSIMLMHSGTTFLQKYAQVMSKRNVGEKLCEPHQQQAFATLSI